MLSDLGRLYLCNRAITQQERDEAIPRSKSEGVTPKEHGDLIGFNSTYVEFIDSSFITRGIFPMFLGMIGLFFGVYGFGYGIFAAVRVGHDVILVSLGFLFSVVVVFFAWKVVFLKDFFCYTYYPIRFNRRTKEIYVFRHNGPGGVLTVPWRAGYFHIGHKRNDEKIMDVRCHVMEGDIVKDTFATGMLCPESRYVMELWEFIRTYMDEGPKKLHVSAILMSKDLNLYNCYVMGGIVLGAGNRLLMTLYSPFIILNCISRWLAMRTCRKPVWPAEVEKACQIDVNDPYRLPEPHHIGQFGDGIAMRKTQGMHQPRPEEKAPSLWRALFFPDDHLSILTKKRKGRK